VKVLASVVHCNINWPQNIYKLNLNLVQEISPVQHDKSRFESKEKCLHLMFDNSFLRKDCLRCKETYKFAQNKNLLSLILCVYI